MKTQKDGQGYALIFEKQIMSFIKKSFLGCVFQIIIVAL
jgi:hypothetical protein